MLLMIRHVVRKRGGVAKLLFYIAHCLLIFSKYKYLSSLFTRLVVCFGPGIQ